MELTRWTYDEHYECYYCGKEGAHEVYDEYICAKCYRKIKKDGGIRVED